ncbi:MAG: hypothetical protein AB2L09_03360 [Coriobacteriia bacterium]
MSTAYTDLIRNIEQRGFHNHRLEDHSEAVSRGILNDLCHTCEPFADDFADGRVREWLDFPSPAGRSRKLDLVCAEPREDKTMPDLSCLRICIENKSVITAHRNRTNRYDDLSDLVGVLHRNRPDAILVATVLVGMRDKVLNVPDRVKPFMSPAEFDERVAPRLSTGDQSLWTDFPYAISKNSPSDPAKTVAKFRDLPVRPPGRTDLVAYDFVLLVPVDIDNVNPPRIASDNPVGIDVDAEYRQMLEAICRAYRARWHT